jgi:hypothetical protein
MHVSTLNAKVCQLHRFAPSADREPHHGSCSTVFRFANLAFDMTPTFMSSTVLARVPAMAGIGEAYTHLRIQARRA